MATFKYQALSRNGERVTGLIEGFNEMDAASRIKQEYSVILKLTPVKERGNSLLNMEIGGNKLNSKAFTVMCSQFAIILKAGVPLARTVQLIAEKTTDKPLKRMLQQVAEDVEAGRTLTMSFSERGAKLLPTTFVETIRSGEESGNLSGAFESMYVHFDKQTKMAGKVRGALIYPAFVLAIAVVVVIILMAKVVPTFTEILNELDSEMPLITRILINISEFFRNYTLIMVVVAVFLALVYKFYSNTEDGRLNTARLQLKLPVFGNIAELNAASQFANTMATLLGAGLPLTRAINITARVLDNYFIGEEVGKMASSLEQGYRLGDCMRQADCLPDILVDMVAVGEETGELTETLHTIAGYYDEELSQAVAKAIATLEPTILIFVAGIAGFIVIAIYVAMFSMYAAM